MLSFRVNGPSHAHLTLPGNVTFENTSTGTSASVSSWCAHSPPVVSTHWPSTPPADSPGPSGRGHHLLRRIRLPTPMPDAKKIVRIAWRVSVTDHHHGNLDRIIGLVPRPDGAALYSGLIFACGGLLALWRRRRR